MALDFVFERALFAHSIENPPAQDLASHIRLNLTNSTGLIDLIRFGPGDQTEYVLTLERPLEAGFTGSGQSDLDTGLNNLVLAMNLSLSATCLMQTRLGSVDSKVKIKPQPTKPSTTTDDGQGHFTANLEDHIHFRDHVSVGFGMKEEIDEPTVLAIFKRLQKVRSVAVTSTSSFRESNLAKALEAYELAMKSPDRLAIFKELYRAIELAANYDGTKVEDHDAALDKKISRLTGVLETDAFKWRDLNRRIKHADQKVAHVETYLKLVAELPGMNRKVRDCAKTLLLARLP